MATSQATAKTPTRVLLARRDKASAAPPPSKCRRARLPWLMLRKTKVLRPWVTSPKSQCVCHTRSLLNSRTPKDLQERRQMLPNLQGRLLMPLQPQGKPQMLTRLVKRHQRTLNLPRSNRPRSLLQLSRRQDLRQLRPARQLRKRKSLQPRKPLSRRRKPQRRQSRSLLRKRRKCKLSSMLLDSKSKRSRDQSPVV